MNYVARVVCKQKHHTALVLMGGDQDTARLHLSRDICVQANFRPLPKEVKNKNDNKKTPNSSEWAGPGTEQPPKTPPPWYYIRGMTLGETQLSDHSMPCRWRHTICGLLFTNDSSFLGHKKF